MAARKKSRSKRSHARIVEGVPYYPYTVVFRARGDIKRQRTFRAPAEKYAIEAFKRWADDTYPRGLTIDIFDVRRG